MFPTFQSDVNAEWDTFRGTTPLVFGNNIAAQRFIIITTRKIDIIVAYRGMGEQRDTVTKLFTRSIRTKYSYSKYIHECVLQIASLSA